MNRAAEKAQAHPLHNLHHGKRLLLQHFICAGAARFTVKPELWKYLYKKIVAFLGLISKFSNPFMISSKPDNGSVMLRYLMLFMIWSSVTAIQDPREEYFS